MKRFFYIIFLLLPTAYGLQPLLSQPLNSVYENNTLFSFEKYVYGLDSSFHTSIRPYLVSELKKTFNYEKALSSYYISKKGTSSPSSSSLQPSSYHLQPTAYNLLFNRSLFIVEKSGYGFTIDPLFDFGYGYDFEEKRNTWTNTRGFLIQGHIGRDFAFATTFYETQAKVPGWISSYAGALGIIPGQGRTKTFGTNAFDYANSSGYFSWSPSEHFNFQFGHGKQFWGDGYRSLILSDHSANHPYGLINAQFWKIKYLVLYSQYTNPPQGFLGDMKYERKFSSFHYLSFLPWNRINISLFEGILWAGKDSTIERGFDMNYLNPVIFFRPVEFNLGSGDNAIIGFNLRYSFTKNLVGYGQVVFDEFKIKEMTSGNGWSGNKYGWQLGLKYFDPFGIDNLYLQSEVNFIRPYTYSHYNLVQNYSHGKEPLAHPSGANIKEAIAIAKYSYKRLYLNLKYVWSASGLDNNTTTSYGKNIFRDPSLAPDEYGNFITQGIYTTLNQFDASLSFLVNPSTNANVFISFTSRREENVNYDRRYSYLGFGFRTSLRNIYYDFF